MELQEIFDKSANHLLTQDSKACNGSACEYKTSEGKKCAIGIFIPDELYQPEMEGKTVNALCNEFSDEMYEIFGEITPHKLSLLHGLQKIHDDREIYNWKRYLNMLAIEFQLKPLSDETTEN